MKLFSKIALATATVSIASFASAASVSGSTDFRVTLPEILVLYHWDDAHLILESTNSVINDSTAHDETQTLAGSHVLNSDSSKNVSTTSTTNIDNNAVNVTLKNAWAVRSLSNAPVTLALTTPKPTLYSVVATTTGAGVVSTDSKIEINANSAKLKSGSTDKIDSGNNSNILKVKSGWQPVMGDIDFTLDLTKANHSGEYNTRGVAGKNNSTDGDAFLLTLTGN